MLNKIIQQLEEAKYCKHDFTKAGIEEAISIIKKHEKEFEAHIMTAWDDGFNIGYTGESSTSQDYYNQNYKNAI